ncbi:AAA family ATPase [Coraliomargarita sp. SDUM461003]|uniref:AAA family ATPase n=1 Tax=Thalassobacterium maritimum TaxID=3041265 RepID=A0ABU1AYX8_9BACT|nr:AAA family ATPase [Coraliomargarita sp. SDUM461003]MDQ8209370.1 AAA family ATPase [Coraliomargarita sp. SDUM461003]
MIQSEYIRFLQTLIGDETPSEVRKVANLVLAHLETLIPLSTSQGQRIKKLVELAQANWTTTSAGIEPAPEQTTSQTCPFTQLKSISVGPFRGFAKQEDFDLSNELVLIYGPNGTGKSSFCEALEFGLLGSVAEAESKRLRQQDYLKNAHTNSFSPPALIGLDAEGSDVAISADEALYRFCFVEKNRIDNFSRIAAQAPAKQTELISTLFGLDAFTNFVGNFTSEMDDRYIDREGVKAKELAQKKVVLAGHELQLKTTNPEEVKSIETAETVLAEAYREGCSFDTMVAELKGADEKPGRIKQLETELQKQLPPKRNLTATNLDALKQSIENDVSEIERKQAELEKLSQQVSFKQLYEAVEKLQESSPEQCPACQTPLSQVAENPFSHAGAELKKLEHLGLLQEAVKTLQDSFSTSLTQLSGVINTCCSVNNENNPLSEIQPTEGGAADINWWKSLLQTSGNDSSSFEHLESQVRAIEEADKEIDKATAERAQKQTELDQLRAYFKQIVELNTRTKTASETRRKAEGALATFAEENADLIKEVEAEKAVVAQNNVIASAYDSFVQKLNDYKDGLPAQLVADLGEKVVEIYNAFNRNDAEIEKLASIRLPLSRNQRLEISLRKDPEEFFDALHILSEGHIRCIGLAILCAKNLKEDCPLLIFDDPVNAIDEDHRESIRRTLFENIDFGGKQIVIACHGEEFFKDIQNLLPAEQARQAKTVSFLPQNGAFHVSVDLNCAPRNYIVSARSHFERNEVRDALDKSRKALEALTKNKVWRYVNRYGDGNLSIKMRSSTSPIELRNLTEQLKCKIANATFADQNKSSILTPLESLLGINGDSREWRYLNKGTHEEEDRAEFARETVNEIIAYLESIDSALA